ncbi:MAG: response regulator transcription factor [Thermaerobacter sp.]|nr:response regulator transcription factor [Thermaerobacter sp.]
MTQSLRLIVVEDEPLFLELLAIALRHHPVFEVVGTYQNPDDARSDAFALRPDVALLDIHLGPHHNGIQLGLQLRRTLPELGIVLLSNHSDPEYLRALPNHVLPGWAYLLKQSVTSLDTLARAINGAAAKLLVLDPGVIKGLHAPDPNGSLKLSPRQIQILSLIAEGYSNFAIAKSLHLAEKSVENQINSLYQILQIERSDPALNPRVQAVRCYLAQKPT